MDKTSRDKIPGCTKQHVFRRATNQLPPRVALLSDAFTSITLVFVVLAAFVLMFSLFLGCRGETNGGAESAKGSESSAAAVSPVGDLSTLEITATFPRETYSENMTVADMRGDADPEIALLRQDGLSLYNLEGSEELQTDLKGISYGFSSPTDVDGDGKSELLLGSRGGDVGRIAMVNGAGNVLNEYSLAEMVRGWVKPAISPTGSIVCATGSEYNISPKAVGSISPGDTSPAWLRQIGPAIRRLEISDRDGAVILSTTALSRDRRGVNPEEDFDTPMDVAQLLLYSAEGELLLHKTFGGKIEEGRLQGDAYAAVDAHFFGQMDEEIAVVLQAYSDFYGLPPSLRLYNRSGEEIFSRTGPENSRGSVTSRGESLFLAWSKAGLVQKIDGSGEVIAEADLEGEVHNAFVCGSETGRFASGNYSAHQAGDYPGARSPEKSPILVRSGNTLSVFDADLQLIWRRTFPGLVTDARFGRDGDGNPFILVQAEKYYLLRPGSAGSPGSGLPRSGITVYTDPAGLPVTVRIGEEEYHSKEGVFNSGACFPDLPAGEANIEILGMQKPLTVTAQPAVGKTVDLRGGRQKGELGSEVPQFENRNIIDPFAHPRLREDVLMSPPVLRSSREIPHRIYRIFTGNYLPDSGEPGRAKGVQEKELLLLDRESGKTSILDGELKTRASFSPVSPQSFPIKYPIDYDGDGIYDIAALSEDPLGLKIFSSDGKPLFFADFMPAYDGRHSILGWNRNRIFFLLGTGYMEYPRGLLGVDRWSGELDFFYPTALRTMHFDTPIIDDTLFLTCTTVSNGVTLERDDGYVLRDTELYRHIVDIENGGTRAAGSGPIVREENTGEVLYFAFETKEGVRVGSVENKNEAYYRGDPVLSLWNKENSSFEARSEGPPHGRTRGPMVLHTTEGMRILIGWRVRPLIGVYDKNLDRVDRIELPKDIKGVDLLAAIAHADSDGFTLFARSGGSVIVLSDEGEEQYRIPVQEDSIIRALEIEDLDGDGTVELIVGAENKLTVYSYETNF